MTLKIAAVSDTHGLLEAYLAKETPDDPWERRDNPLEWDPAKLPNL